MINAKVYIQFIYYAFVWFKRSFTILDVYFISLALLKFPF